MQLSAPAAPGGVSGKPWGIPAILLALAVPLLLWASSLAIAVAEGTPDDLSDGEIIVSLILTVIILDGLFIAAPAAICIWRYKLNWGELGFRAFDRGDWYLPVLVAAGAHVGLIIYAAVLTLVGADAAVPEQDIEDLFDSRAVLPMVGFATVIMAPLAEELFFRGFIFSGLIRPLGVTGAMVASGVLFGTFHVTGSDSIGLIVPFSVIGALFAWLYYRTGSIWPSIGAHFLFNLVSFVVLASVAGRVGL